MMRLALTAADVTGPATEEHPDGRAYPGVTVLTRNGQLVLQSRAGVTLGTWEASAVRDGGAARTWLVDTVDGVFTVARKRGCGCR